MKRMRKSPGMSFIMRRRSAKSTPLSEILAVGVDVLAEQRNVLVALGSTSSRASSTISSGRRDSLTAADVGHDAVGAEIVAAVHDRQPGLDAAVAPQGHALGDRAVALSRWRKRACGLSWPAAAAPGSATARAARKRDRPRGRTSLSSRPCAPAAPCSRTRQLSGRGCCFFAVVKLRRHCRERASPRARARRRCSRR